MPEIQEIQTRKEMLIQTRNRIALRALEWEIDINYWHEKGRHSKKGSQELLTAQNEEANNRKNLAKDALLLEVIDNLLQGEK